MATPSRVIIPSSYLPWFDRTVFCWRPIGGNAQRDFDAIEPQIQDTIRPVLLEAIYQDFDLLACLFGKSAEIQEARPSIVLASRDARRVKRARELIISSGILKSVLTPFRIEIMPSTPYGTAIPVASYAPDLILSTQDLPHQSLGVESNQATTQARGYEVLFKPKSDPSGTIIEIYVRIDGNNLHRATGYLVVHEGEPEYLCLTAAHAFASTHDTETEREREREKLTTWGADYRFTIDDSITSSGPLGTPVSRAPANIPANASAIGASPNTENSLAKMSSPSQYDMVQKGSEEERRKKAEGDSDTETSTRETEFELTNVTGKPPNIPNEEMPNIDNLETLGNLKHLASDCDWAMIEVTNEKLIRDLSSTTARNPIEPITNSDDAEIRVIASTYDGMIHGILLPGQISQKVPGGTTMKRVLLFQATYFDMGVTGLIRKGDCGSPVVDLATNKLYGHIISVSEDGRTAFVMSASDALSAIKTEAKIGRVSWSTSGWSQLREEYSLRGNTLESGQNYQVAAAETWMDRHNTLLANRKEFSELPSDNSEGAKTIKIAIVDVEPYYRDPFQQFPFSSYVRKKHLYNKWAEQLSELLSEMAPFAAIRRSSILSTKVTCSAKAGSHALIHRVQMPIGSVDLSSVNWRPNMEPFEKSKAEVTLDEFSPDIIVLVSTYRGENDRDMEFASEIAKYAEEKGIILIVSAPEGDQSQNDLIQRSKDTQMIRAYSTDGDGNAPSRIQSRREYFLWTSRAFIYDEQRILTLGDYVRTTSTSLGRSGPQLERLEKYTYGRLVSGNGCAAVVAAGIASMVLRCMQGVLKGEEWLRLRRTSTMYAVLKGMSEINPENGLFWITHWEWFGTEQRELELEKLVRGALSKAQQ